MLREGSNYLKIDGRKVHLHVEGRGEPLIVVHGWASEWDKPNRRFVKYLRANFQVILLNLPGFGGSEELKSKHTMKNYSELILKIMKKLKIKKAYLVAHSMGTLIVSDFSIRYPNRTKGVLLLGMPFKMKIKPLFNIVRGDLESFFGSWVFRNNISRFFISLPLIMTGTDRNEVDDIFDKICIYSPRVLGETMRDILDTDVLNLYMKIKVPKLLVHGNDDEHVSLPNTELDDLTILLKTGHVMFSTVPREISKQITDFFLGLPK